MSNNYFKFKQFTIYQEKSAMKVGTDGVLLGSWANVANCKRILDIGTGTGVLALMLGQRATSAKITAIEIEKNAATEASQNVALSPWNNRIDVQNISFQEFEEKIAEKYDLIVSNPPFFQNSQKTKSQARTIARHNDLLPFSILLQKTSVLLNNSGRCAFILPIDAEQEFSRLASKNKLYLLRKTEVKPNSKKLANRVLLEFGKEKSALQISSIIIYNDNGLWSDDYKKLCEDFYLYI